MATLAVSRRGEGGLYCEIGLPEEGTMGSKELQALIEVLQGQLEIGRAHV